MASAILLPISQEYISVVKRSTSNLPPVLGVRQELEQVLLDLLVNAWHAMPGSGAITIVTEQRGVQAVMAITDTAAGMPQRT